MVSEQLMGVVEFLEMIREDQDSSKKLKEDLGRVIGIIKEDKELAIERAVLELEDINSQGLSSYIKTQIWDVISQLESLNSSS